MSFRIRAGADVTRHAIVKETEMFISEIALVIIKTVLIGVSKRNKKVWLN